MDKLRVQVNGRGYYLRTDKPDEVLAFAKVFEEKILHIKTKMPNAIEAETTALAALLLLADSLKKERSEEDAALFEELSGNIEVLEERKQTLENEIILHNEKEAALEAEIARMQAAFDVEIAALKAENDSLKAGLEDAEARCGDVSGKLDESETAVSDVKSALSSANKIIAQLNTEKLTEVAANEALRNELDAARDRLENANKTIAELNGKLTNMEINSEVADIPADVKKLKAEKEELEIELAIANEEIENLKANAPVTDAALSEKIAEYEKKIRSLEGRSGEMDKLRGILAETEQSVRQKCEEKENENQKLRNILKNYENSYGITLAKKENEINLLQMELEQLRERLNVPETEKIGGSYVQTTFDA